MDPFAFYALVVDDNPLIRMDAQTILTNAGFRVFGASGCDEALEILALRGHALTLLFTDVQMPPGTMTGIDLARWCATQWPHVGILVTSAVLLPSTDDLPDGAAFIRKPFDAAVVRHHLKQILPGHRQPLRLRMSLL